MTYSYNALNLASVNAFLANKVDSMLFTAASVTGGRCLNERYAECHAKRVLDLDFVSCYGSSLRDLSFPIGLPSVYAASVNEKGLTLKSFLKKRRKEFKDGFWKIVVSGKLSFSQDLIYSKVESPSTIARLQKLVLQESVIKQHREHVMLQKEIYRGVLTSHFLEIIEKVSTSQELKEWMDLCVDSAVWYPKEKEITDIAKWSKTIVNSSSKSDLSSWCSLPLNKFIDPLLEERAELKAEIKINKDKEIHDRLVAKDRAAKLFINTLYGCISSPFFRICNTVLGDNITARPRAEIWLAVKALNGYQSITDGFCYSPENINRLNQNNKGKPGFDAFSSFYKLQKHRSIEKQSLLEKDWFSFFDKEEAKTCDYKDIDKAALNAVNEFWEPYECRTSFKMEHKAEHTARRMGYWGKAHYFLDTVHDNYIVKTRGVDKHFELSTYDRPNDMLDDTSTSEIVYGIESNPENLNYIPTHHLLLNLCLEKDEFPKHFSYIRKKRTTRNFSILLNVFFAF